MHTKLRSKLLFIIICSFAAQAGELALVGSSEKSSTEKSSTGLLEKLPPELLSEICWQTFATRQPCLSFGQNVLPSRRQRAQAILDIDIHSVNSFEQVSQQIKNAVSGFKINCKKNYLYY